MSEENKDHEDLEKEAEEEKNGKSSGKKLKQRCRG